MERLKRGDQTGQAFIEKKGDVSNWQNGHKKVKIYAQLSSTKKDIAYFIQHLPIKIMCCLFFMTDLGKQPVVSPRANTFSNLYFLWQTISDTRRANMLLLSSSGFIKGDQDEYVKDLRAFSIVFIQ